MVTMVVAVRAVYAAPSAAVAQVKAVDCCARHCDHRNHPVRPDDCCQVLSQATDAALLSAPAGVHGAGVLPPAAREGRGATPSPVLLSEHALEPCRSGPPLFLAIRSLRL